MEYLRILGSGALTTGYTTVYKVAKAIGGDNARGPIPEAVVGSIILCETNNVAATVSIRVVPKADTGGNQHEIFDTLPLAANATKIISPGITLATEDSIEAKASTTDVNMFVFGSEIK